MYGFNLQFFNTHTHTQCVWYVYGMQHVKKNMTLYPTASADNQGDKLLYVAEVVMGPRLADTACIIWFANMGNTCSINIQNRQKNPEDVCMIKINKLKLIFFQIRGARSTTLWRSHASSSK